MSEVTKAPSLEEQFEAAASDVEKIANNLSALPQADQVVFRKDLGVVVGLLRRVAHELYKQDQVIESMGKSHDKLLARVHELSTVSGTQEWADLMARFGKLVERDKEVGAESAPLLQAVLVEILKAQRNIIDLETQIKELKTKGRFMAKPLEKREALEKRVGKFKRSLQTMFNSMQSSDKADMAVPPRAVMRGEKTLGDGCALVEELIEQIKSRDEGLIEAAETAMKETELLSATQVECGELQKTNHELGERVKCLDSYLEDAQVKINNMAEELLTKDEELSSLRINYAECLSRLFKAKIMRPEELYSKGALFLPQVTFTPENDGFYEVNPEWHDKVVNDLELDLKDPGHRRTYERVLIASAARLHNNNYPVADGDKQEITVVVAWDAYFSFARKSPTFSTGKLPLFKPAMETMVFSYQADNGWEKNDKKDAVLSDVEATSSYGDVEPPVLDMAQPHIDIGLYTISKQFVVWFNANKSRGEADMNELYTRNDFRTYLSEKVKRFLDHTKIPVVVIDWDAAAITGLLNFMCPELDEKAPLIIRQLSEGNQPSLHDVTL